MYKMKSIFDSSPFVKIVQVAERNGQLDELQLYLVEYEVEKLRSTTRNAKQLVKELLSGIEDRKVLEKHKTVLYRFSEERLGSALHYEWLLNRTERSREEQEKLVEYVGDYVQVFGSSDNEKLFSKTELKIIQKNKRFNYENKVTFKNGKDFTYTGYVFYSERILYFSGLNKNYARPFMCFVKFPEVALSESLLRGGMLGLHDPNLNIYFREFVLIPNGHKLFNQFKQVVSEREVSHLFEKKLCGLELNPASPIMG